MPSSYAAKFLYADQITGTTSATVTAGQLLIVSGDGTVGPAGALAANVVGVACHDAASGALVTYVPRGPVHITVNSGGVTAGDQLASAASGLVATLPAAAAALAADINKAREVLGVALTTAADTVAVTWMQF